MVMKWSMGGTLLGILLLVASPASAQNTGYYTAANLLKDCGDYLLLNEEPKLATNKSLTALGQCHGFITGVVEAMGYFRAATSKQTGFPACLPEHVNFDLLIRLTMKYLDESATPPAEPAITTTISTLKAAYPCP